MLNGRKRKKLSIRSKGYKALRIGNDINALAKGKYPQRLIRKWTHKKAGKGINRLFK